jgi:ribonuclease HI
MRRNINAFCDGACKGNPGYGGWGAVAIETSPDTPEFYWIAHGGKKKTTNQEMELQAMFECLRICPFNSDIKITGDNQTVLKGLVNGGISGKVERAGGGLKGPVIFTGWIGKWKPKPGSSSNQWKKADGKPPSSLELWKAVALLCEKHIESGSTLEFAWTRGHNGDEGNELADQLANLGASKYK